jgi:ketosteroid isomerase-like protein
MPWFPDFANAAELAREQTRAAGLADPVREYLTAVDQGDARALETVWPGEVVIYDPRAGVVRGHRQVRQFIARNLSWLAGLHARTETVATTRSGRRAVVELMARVDHNDGELVWPVAVVAESPGERSVVFRTYCSQWPVDERRHVRPPVLERSEDVQPDGVMGRYVAALAAGDAEAVVSTFAPDGYFRGPFGPRAERGADELRSFFTWCFSGGGGIGLEQCAVTDDGVRCAAEYNCVSWGRKELPPQAGLAVYERGPDGLLTAVRVYDDIESPVGRFRDDAM